MVPLPKPVRGLGTMQAGHARGRAGLGAGERRQADRPGLVHCCWPGPMLLRPTTVEPGWCTLGLAGPKIEKAQWAFILGLSSTKD